MDELVEAAGSQERRIEHVATVRRALSQKTNLGGNGERAGGRSPVGRSPLPCTYNDEEALGTLDAVHLVKQCREHALLNRVAGARTRIGGPLCNEGVDLVEEEHGRKARPTTCKQLAHYDRTRPSGNQSFVRDETGTKRL